MQHVAMYVYREMSMCVYVFASVCRAVTETKSRVNVRAVSGFAYLFNCKHMVGEGLLFPRQSSPVLAR